MFRTCIALTLLMIGVLGPWNYSAAQVNDVSISGQVIDSTGAPSANTAITGNGFGEIGTLCCPFVRATTNASGAFSFQAPAGLLVLSAVPPDPHAPQRFSYRS